MIKTYSIIGYAFKEMKVFLVMTNIETGKIILKKIAFIEEGVIEYKTDLYEKLSKLLFDESIEYVQIENFLDISVKYYSNKDKWDYLAYSKHKTLFKVDVEEYNKLKERVEYLCLSKLATRAYVML